MYKRQFNRWAWGDASLNAFLGPPLSHYFDLWQAPRGLMGMLLDQEWGLLPWVAVTRSGRIVKPVSARGLWIACARAVDSNKQSGGSGRAERLSAEERVQPGWEADVSDAELGRFSA